MAFLPRIRNNKKSAKTISTETDDAPLGNDETISPEVDGRPRGTRWKRDDPSVRPTIELSEIARKSQIWYFPELTKTRILRGKEHRAGELGVRPRNCKWALTPLRTNTKIHCNHQPERGSIGAGGERGSNRFCADMRLSREFTKAQK